MTITGTNDHAVIGEGMTVPIPFMPPDTPFDDDVYLRQHYSGHQYYGIDLPTLGDAQPDDVVVPFHLDGDDDDDDDIGDDSSESTDVDALSD